MNETGSLDGIWADFVTQMLLVTSLDPGALINLQMVNKKTRKVVLTHLEYIQSNVFFWYEWLRDTKFVVEKTLTGHLAACYYQEAKHLQSEATCPEIMHSSDMRYTERLRGTQGKELLKFHTLNVDVDLARQIQFEPIGCQSADGTFFSLLYPRYMHANFGDGHTIVHQVLSRTWQVPEVKGQELFSRELTIRRRDTPDMRPYYMRDTARVDTDLVFQLGSRESFERPGLVLRARRVWQPFTSHYFERDENPPGLECVNGNSIIERLPNLICVEERGPSITRWSGAAKVFKITEVFEPTMKSPSTQHPFYYTEDFTEEEPRIYLDTFDPVTKKLTLGTSKWLIQKSMEPSDLGRGDPREPELGIQPVIRPELTSVATVQDDIQ